MIILKIRETEVLNRKIVEIFEEYIKLWWQILKTHQKI